MRIIFLLLILVLNNYSYANYLEAKTYNETISRSEIVHLNNKSRGGNGGGIVGGGGGGDTITAKRLFVSTDEQDSYFRVMKKEEIDQTGLLKFAQPNTKVPNSIQFFLNEDNDSQIEGIRVLTNFSDIESIKLKDGRVIHFSNQKLNEKLEKFYSR